VHICCFTCWKYNQLGDKTCRFNFPWKQEDTSVNDCVIKKDRDRKSKVRVRIFPPRNNAWLNVSCVQPLLSITNSGNTDGQYVSNVHGAVEYCAAYSSKADEPDTKMLINLYSKSIATILKNNEGIITDRDKLRSCSNAVVCSQQVGTVQCCYALLKLKVVHSSRQCVVISPKPVNELSKTLITNKEVLNQLNDDDSAFAIGPKSQLGKRVAFAELNKELWGKYGGSEITMFAIYSDFNVDNYKSTTEDETKGKIAELPNLKVDENGN
jgi:hypothetical protein